MKESRYIFSHDYMADPSARVFNGRIYVYPSHDRESGIAENDNGDHFDMRDYHCLSLDNPESDECRDEGRILDIDDIPWAHRQLWDNDVIEKDGRYYMCFCAKDYNDIFRLGIAISDCPEGPFVPQPDPIRGSYSIDPAFLKDDDGAVYLYFGGIWGGQLQRYRDNRAIETPHLPAFDQPALAPRVVRMADDMLQFAEEPRPVEIYDKDGILKHGNPHRFFEGSWIHKRGDKYIFSYSTGDSHLLCYAVGDSPYGPFEYRGVLLDPVGGWTTHHSICRYGDKWYLFHHDSAPSGGRTWLRSAKVMEISFDV